MGVLMFCNKDNKWGFVGHLNSLDIEEYGLTIIIIENMPELWFNLTEKSVYRTAL